MQFLRTLFWVALAVLLVLFASVNWEPVTVNLWGGLEADVKLPVLVFAAFLAGFLPMLILHRARMWTLRRRLEAHERQIVATFAQPVPPPEGLVRPSEAVREEDRIATDSKAWPTT